MKRRTEGPRCVACVAALRRKMVRAREAQRQRQEAFSHLACPSFRASPSLPLHTRVGPHNTRTRASFAPRSSARPKSTAVVCREGLKREKRERGGPVVRRLAPSPSPVRPPIAQAALRFAPAVCRPVYLVVRALGAETAPRTADLNKDDDARAFPGVSSRLPRRPGLRTSPRDSARLCAYARAPARAHGRCRRGGGRALRRRKRKVRARGEENKVLQNCCLFFNPCPWARRAARRARRTALKRAERDERVQRVAARGVCVAVRCAAAVRWGAVGRGRTCVRAPLWR